MDETLDQMLGIDKNKEIFSLWYEVTYLRMLLNHIMVENPEIGKCLTKECLDVARLQAEEIVKKKFPACIIQFSKG